MQADFDDAVLGHGLPTAAEAALREAGLHRQDPPRAMAALMRAQSLAPEHPAVLIALYRDHFYGHRLAPARDIARRALLAGATALGLPACWRNAPRQALEGARDEPVTRFYLFSLKGYAYLSLRLGDMDEARDALAVLRDLDPQDRVGAALLEGVRQRRAHLAAHPDEDDDRGLPMPVFGQPAWTTLQA